MLTANLFGAPIVVELIKHRNNTHLIENLRVVGATMRVGAKHSHAHD
jgi:hypothetical protein